jgi:hypothetical protein
MSRKVVPVAMNGVTGRMGYRQHLVRSLLSIRDQGGVPLDDGTVIYPEPILVGRSEQRLRAIAERHGLERWTTSLDEVLSDPGSRAWPRLSRPASMSTPRSRWPTPWRVRCGSPPPHGRRASPTASCRTSCSCRACSSCSG